MHGLAKQQFYHEDENKDRCRDCQETAEQEDDLIRVQKVGLDVTKPVRKKTADYIDDTEHGVPCCIAVRLFGALVPHLHDGDEGGCYDTSVSVRPA
jgi:hypothetical protein